MHGQRRPAVGDAVLFVAGKDPKGCPRAVHLRLAGDMTLDRAAIRIKPRKAAEQARPTIEWLTNHCVGPAALQAGGC